MVMGLQPTLYPSNIYIICMPCQYPWQLCPYIRIIIHHRPRRAADRLARPRLASVPPVGSGKCSASKPPQPAHTNPDRRSVLSQSKQIDITRPHQVEGNLWRCSVRSSSMRPGGLCLPVSRSVSSDGQSHAADDPAGQSVTQRPTRPDLMSCVRPW